MVSFVAGGAGFIGASLVAGLLADGGDVVVADNYVRGDRAHLAAFADDPRLLIIEADLAQAEDCQRAFAAARARGPIGTVWHLAANSDIPAGVADSSVDLRDTFLTTYEILRQMKDTGARRLVFASSSAIYGDLADVELREDLGPLLPISNYGAMKLASEALASAAAEAFLDQAVLLRFPNVVGTPATHGVILDFVRRLRDEPAVLRVLGNGEQRKPYLHVAELVSALRFSHDKAPEGVSVFNIGPADEGVTVRWIAEQVVARVSPGARIEFEAHDRGWVGDVPRFRYSIAKLAALGWRPGLSSGQALTRAVDEIARQEGL